MAWGEAAASRKKYGNSEWKATEISGLSPALCAAFSVKHLAEEIRLGGAPSKWSDIREDDGFGLCASAALRAICAEASAAVSTAPLSQEEVKSCQSKLQNYCDKALDSIVGVEALLAEALQDLIQAVADCQGGTTCTSRAMLPPPWSASVSARYSSTGTSHSLNHRTPSPARHRCHSNFSADTQSPGIVGQRYLETLRNVFLQTDNIKALRAPPAMLTASLPLHLQDTVVELARSVTRIRASLASRASHTLTAASSTLHSRVIPLDTLHEDLARFVAQLEAADEVLSCSSAASLQLGGVAESAFQAAEFFVERHGSTCSPDYLFTPEKSRAAKGKIMELPFSDDGVLGKSPYTTASAMKDCPLSEDLNHKAAGTIYHDCLESDASNAGEAKNVGPIQQDDAELVLKNYFGLTRRTNSTSIRTFVASALFVTLAVFVSRVQFSEL